jgi:hypothetical protein
MLPVLAHPGVFPPEVRAQATALACSLPREQGVPLARWSSRALATQLVALGVVLSIAASTLRRWLALEKLKPWRFRLWQHILDPLAFMERARPVLDLYQEATALLKAATWVSCLDEKTSIQARCGEQPPQAARPNQLATTCPRYKRGGAVQLFGALSVADGRVLGQCRLRKCFADLQAFLKEVVVVEAQRRAVTTVALILDNGPTHAPKQLAGWLAELVEKEQLPFRFEVYWLPVRASWLDQIEIWFSQLQSKLLRPNHFENWQTLAQSIMAFIDYYNLTAQPLKWTYTVDKLAHKLGMDL